jgi:hypothetical protein
MEEEIETGIEVTGVENQEIESSLPESITNMEILKIIFSRNTAPHAFSLSLFLIVLGVFTRSSSQFFVDLILILGYGFSLGYLATALLMRFESIKRFSSGTYKNILLIPLTLSLLISFSLFYVFEFTEYGDKQRDFLSLGFVIIFVIWQFAQAWWMRVPFKELAFSRMLKVKNKTKSNFGKYANGFSPLLWSLIGFAVFSAFESQGTEFSSTFIILWFVMMAFLGSATFYLLYRMNSKNWSDPMISVFSAYFAIGYWSFLAYHLGVMLYSRESQPSFVFDLVFMVITIMLVIYSLSAQALRSETRNKVGHSKKSRMINPDNVIFYAISFTAAYGASSFFLASEGTLFVNDIKNVGFVSHLIVIASGILVLLLVNYTALVGRGFVDQGFVDSIRAPKDN